MFMVSSADSVRLISHYRDLLWTSVAEIGVELEKKFAASIFDCLDGNVRRDCFGVMRKNEFHHNLVFIFFISENIVTMHS